MSDKKDENGPCLLLITYHSSLVTPSRHVSPVVDTRGDVHAQRAAAVGVEEADALGRLFGRADGEGAVGERDDADGAVPGALVPVAAGIRVPLLRVFEGARAPGGVARVPVRAVAGLRHLSALAREDEAGQ